MKQSIATLAIATASLSLSVWLAVSIKTYIDLPVVGITQEGECQWIEEAPDFERRVCPLVLPEKYERVYVWFDDSKGDEY